MELWLSLGRAAGTADRRVRTMAHGFTTASEAADLLGGSVCIATHSNQHKYCDGSAFTETCGPRGV
jgi:hypothetical protein